MPYQYSSNFIHLVDELAGEEAQQDIKLKWPIIHTRYRELQREDFMKERAVYMGYEVETATTPIGELPVYTGDEVTAIHEFEEKWLKEIIALTKENDIQLVCFLAPMYIE